jgi:hypothetical protein
MANDNLVGKKTPDNTNRDKIPGVKFDSATYIGIVKDNLSPARNGRVWVWIPEFGGDEDSRQNWKHVQYASPYFGTTYTQKNDQNNKFQDVHHTYGMWMTVPDIGSQLLCTFVNGDPSRGYWFAAINPGISSYMVPAIAAGNKIDTSTVSAAIKPSILPANSPTPQYLPVTEFNENIPANTNGTFYNNPKPIHEFQANILFLQGLDRDKVRGSISSSSQRETPSHVFGISTPGRALTKDPADDPDYQSKVESGTIPPDQFAVPSRKGGHTFVMDDGDTNGVDQLIRLRTAGGHQILMNDDQSTMYVAHKNGTTWVEISDNGVNIYTKGDFSLRSEGDMNFHADGDINMQALGSINMDSLVTHAMTSPQIKIGGSESTLIYGAKMSMGGGQIIVSSDGKLSMSSQADMKINGSTIDINGGGGGSSISNPVIQKNKLADTTYDADVTHLWNSVPASVDSIVNILPAHEPWTRTQPPVPLTKQTSTSICPPKVGSVVIDTTLPPPNNNKLDNGKIKGQPAAWTTDTAFITAVQQVASTLNLSYIDMLSCMHLETGGTFDPAITNSLGYTGLIQFGGAAATACGTSTAALREMDRPTQCTYVTKYFQVNNLNTKAPSPRLVDIYLTILWPAAVGKPGSYIIWDSQNPQTSKAYYANPAFDPGHTVGHVTVDMVASVIATHQTTVKQALANAGVSGPASSGTLSSSNGSTVTDGSGNPVKTGTTSTSSADTDVGITEAAGESVSLPTCPSEYLARTTTYNPPGGIGSSSPKLTQQQVKAMMAELGYFESQFNYSLIDVDRIGKYQVDAQYLADAGYIKPDAITQYGTSNTLNQSESWSGKDSIQSENDFFTSANVQDNIQYNEFTNNYSALVANGGILPTDDICTAAGMLFVAHQFRSVDSALKWRQQGAIVDDLGRQGSEYFNQGRYAIDVLAAGGAAQTDTSSQSSASGPGGENTSAINPDDVFVFQSSGSGTRSNFDQLNGVFKSAICQMAQDFKTKSGSKITITSAYRSPADQDAIYQKWVQAGGGPNMPTAGGITTPAKPVSLGGKGSPHNSGVAIDSGQCPLIARTVDLAQYGLRWGGTFGKPDAVHIQLADSSQ